MAASYHEIVDAGSVYVIEISQFKRVPVSPPKSSLTVKVHEPFPKEYNVVKFPSGRKVPVNGEAPPVIGLTPAELKIVLV